MSVNRVLNLSSRDRGILAKSILMETLEPALAARLMDLAAVVNVENREILFREGETPEHFYCVLTGYVRIYRLNRDGREADIRICGAGDTFGECLLALDANYLYNAQAAENSLLARFDLPKVRQLAEQEAEVARALMLCLSDHLRATMDCIANDRLQTAPQRVANFLLTNCSESSGSASIRLPFQKSLLAGKLGLAPEALSRAFSSLKPLGVTVRGRMIVINDVNALRQI